MATRKAATQARRADLMTAALGCFNERGYGATTVEDICVASGASIGSLYHHFASKEMLAAALYVEALLGYQAVMVATLNDNPEAETGVHAAVRAHVGWVVENAELARFLFSVREPDVIGSRQAELNAANQEFFAAARGWLRPHIQAGVIRRLPGDLYYALWIGPAQEFARNLTFGRTRTSWRVAARELGMAAWLALRAQPS